jgi:hypothetical protein
MKTVRRILGIVLIAGLSSAAAAQEICAPLAKLIKDPPAGFMSDRAEPIGPQRWASVPIIPNAKCVVWASRTAEAHNIRCDINDGASASVVTGFFERASGSIDRCLATLPDGGRYDRTTAKVDVGGLTGTETSWIFDSDVLRFKIDLTDYRRGFDGSTYNSFSVEYLKY